ncbi:MAG: gliding motility-associated C-terminal domain-containing protein [Saprospiraceae bacterium]
MCLQPFRLSLIFTLLFSSQILAGQTILWLEDFSGAPPAPGWTDNFMDCDGTPQSFFGVQNGRYEIIDMEGSPCCTVAGGGAGNNEWVTNDITISGYCNVSISVNYGAIGTFECSLGGPYFACTDVANIDNGHDQIVFEYSIDGGGWIQFQYVCGSAPPGPATVTGLTGNTIRVRIRPANKSTAETYWFDDVTVSGSQPTVDPEPDVVVCAGTAVSVMFTGTGSPPPSFNWTNDNTDIGLGASGTGNISFTPPSNLTQQEVATITVTPVSPGCSGPPETFMITVNPLPQTDDPADVVACSGDMVDIIFTGSDPGATYHWTINGLPPNPLFPPSGTGNISGTVPPLPFPVSGTITVHAVSPEGCMGPSQTFSVSLFPAISASFSMTSPSDLCEGQPAVFLVNFSGGMAPYTFTYAIDGVNQPPLTTNNDPFSFNVSLNADATVSAVSMTSGSGCVADVSGSFDVNIIPTPTAILVPGPSNLCEGDALDLQIDFNGTDDYTFTHTINNVPQPGITATGPSYIMTVNPPIGTTTYTLTTVSSNGCTGTASGSHVAIVVGPPTAFISGNPVICSGQNATIPITFSGTAPWTFVYSIDGVDQQPITTSNSPYFIISTYTATTTLELVSVATGNCAGTTSGTAVVTVLAGVTGVLASGTNAICVGQSDTLDFTFTGTAPYIFVYSINGTPQAPITTSNSTYQIAVTPAIPTTYTLTGISNNNCPGGNVSGTYTVNVTNPPTATISGTDTICREHSTLLSISFMGNAPWTFSYAANGVPVDTITTSFNPFTITVSPTATTTYTLTSVSSGSCGGSVSGSATIKVNPNPTVAISGGGQICQSGSGTDIVFTFTGTGPWTVTYRANNDTLTATSSVSPLLIHVNPNIGTIYRLIEISDSLCTDTAVGQVVVFVFTPANAQFLGSATFCDSANTQVSVDFTGTGPFTINYTINGVAQQPDTTFDDPYIIPVNVTSTTTFALTSIESPGCTGIITGGPAVITVNYAPTYTNLNINCNFLAGTYVVTFDVLGATPPLSLVGGNSGSFSGSQWTSNPIPLAMPYSFTFRDANNCGDVTVSGANTCNCTTEAGTMGLGLIDACESQVINAAYNGGFVNDGNDTLLFILHSNPALPIGTIFGWNSIPSFGMLVGMTPGTTYYISAISGNISPMGLVDTSDLCTVVSQGTPVIFHAAPVGDMGVTTHNICQGDSITLTVNFSGTAPFTFATDILGMQQPPVGGINGSSYSWTIAPSMNTVIELDSVADQYCPNGQALGMATIVVFQPPVVSNVTTQCDYSNATYTVSFDIVSGTPTFSVFGLAGFFAGNTFTSIPIPFASGNFFATLVDANSCGQDTISGMSNCNCTGNAGIMDQTPINACQNTVLNVPPAQNTVLDMDDQLMYIIHTNPSVPLGTILGWSTTPSFMFGGAMQTGITYYVSSIVGNPDGNGMIDLLDPCLTVAIGTPVQWLETPTATLASATYDICAGGTQALLVTLSGTPNFILGYTNNGNPFSVTATQTAFLLNATLQQTATFVLTSVSDANCTGSVSGTAVVNVHPPVSADNFITNCSPATQTYTVEFDITQGDLNNISVANLTGIYNPATGHFVSNPIPNGQPYSVIITDNWNCGSYNFSDSVNCACTTDAGIMDPSPLMPCYGQTVSTSTAAGVFLETGDTLLYFLVGQSNMPPSWTIVDVSSTPSFVFNPATMMVSTPYYIVAVAGNIGGVNGVDLNDPCLSIVPGPTVMWHPEITAALSGAPEVCPGSPASIVVQFTGDGPFNFSYTDGSIQTPLTGITQNPYTIQVTPAISTGYSLVNVTGAGNCPGNTSGNASVTISNPPQVLNLSVNCDLASETYTLTFDIGNGAQANPTYTVLGIQGTLTDTTFTSISYPGTQPYNVVIGNPTGCTTTLSGMASCACLTNAGTLSNALNGCLPAGIVSAQPVGNQTLDADDMLIYVLCTDPAVLPMGILAQGNLPQFGFQSGMTAGITYYIVALAGNTLGNTVDLSDPCLSVSPGVPVVFHFPPSALIVGDVTLCEGDDATFQVQLAGVGPYQFVYALNGIPQVPVSTPSNSFNILTNNVQQNQMFTLVSVSDANCPGTVNGQATVTVTPTPTGSISSNISICAGNSATLSLNLSGGTSYDVTIAGTTPPTQLLGVQNGATFTVSPSSTTTYTITNLVAAGTVCPSVIGQSATVSISTVSATSVLSDFNGFNTSCPLTNDGSITVSPIGGVAPISSAWSNGATGLTNANLNAGNYAVTLTDQIGCTYTNNYTLIAAPELGITFTTESPTCFGDNDGSVTITAVTGGAGPFSLSLNNNVLQTTDVFPVTIPSLGSGVQVIGVEDSNGCFSDADATVTDPAELTVNLGPDTTIHLGDVVLLQALLNFSEVQSFVWTPAEYLDRPDSLTTLASPINTIRYNLLVIDSAGCTARDEIVIIVDKEKRLFIPNVIKPSSDGQNNIVSVFAGEEVSKVRSMRIFDRWGELLFENFNFLPNDPTFGWSGQAKGQDVSPGVYVYVVEVEYVNGETEVFSGDVTVVR